MEEISFSEIFSLDQKNQRIVFLKSKKISAQLDYFPFPHFKKSLISKISPTFEHIHAERISK